MNTTKTIKSASIELLMTVPDVVNGEVIFKHECNTFGLVNIKVPETTNTEEEFEDYLRELLTRSQCDTASICDVCIEDWIDT